MTKHTINIRDGFLFQNLKDASRLSIERTTGATRLQRSPSRSLYFDRRRRVAPCLARASLRWLPLLLISACASGGGDTAQRIQSAQRQYLLSPLDGWTGTRSSRMAVDVQEAFDRMMIRGSTLEARAAGEAILDQDSEFAPARLLVAQAAFIDGRRSTARELLDVVLGAREDYPAAVLLRARIAELESDVVGAFARYRSLQGRLTIAARRATELEAQAVDDVGRQIDDNLASNRIDEARRLHALLTDWVPGSVALLEADWRLAAAAGSEEEELAAVRSLWQVQPENTMALERLAALEFEAGAIQVALRLFERLSAENPNDLRRAELLARARFQWRLDLLPEDVVELTDAVLLSRTDWASMLYWLIPGVRNTSPSRGGIAGGRIAADILDVPPRRRQEIARVINRGLMEVDRALHRFDPGSNASRRDVLDSLLRVLVLSRPAPSCVGDFGATTTPSSDLICQSAARCGLLAETEDCLPTAALGGAEAQDLIRKTLARVAQD